jgi:hypothetical protein
MSMFPYSLSRPKVKTNRLKRIEDTVNRTELKVDDMSSNLSTVMDCLNTLCGTDSPILNPEPDKVKFKVIL